jgi:hypothetical protein
VLDEAPTAARLLQAALMLFNALVPLDGDADQPSAASSQQSAVGDRQAAGARQRPAVGDAQAAGTGQRTVAATSDIEAAEWRDQQPQSDTTELEPVARP